MDEIHIPMRETHIIGQTTREWLISQHTCPVMQQHGLLMAGHSLAGSDFAFVRTNPAFHQLLICLSGRGWVWHSDQWQPCGPHQIYRTSPGALHAYHADASSPWELCWVVYHWPSRPQEAGCQAPVLESAHTTPMHLAISGLYEEATGTADAAALHAWAQLVGQYLERFMQPATFDRRLQPLWEAVRNEPDFPWTLETLASRVQISEEHLRRLCRQHHGQPPMHQVQRLRMQHAESLLLRTDQPIQMIAQAVGYADAFSFATAFKRVMKLSPSACRQKAAGDRPPV